MYEPLECSTKSSTDCLVDSVNSVALVRFLPFESLVGHGEFRRCPDSLHFTVNLNEIDSDSALLVFISHNWLRGDSSCEGWDGRPHPDNVGGEKYKLCIDGIRELKLSYASRFSTCYVWMDYCCINQDNKDLSSELEHYDRIVAICDFVITPIVGDYDKQMHCYLNRAWCRMELMYALNIPAFHHSDSNRSRVNKFDTGMIQLVIDGKRPHLAFKSYDKIIVERECVFTPIWQDSTNFDSILCKSWVPIGKLFSSDVFAEGNKVGKLPTCLAFCLSQGRGFNFELYSTSEIRGDLHPLNGHLTRESDKCYLSLLMAELQPYIDGNALTSKYKGNLTDAGVRHGWGILVFSNGNSYEGEWRDDKMCGQGKYTWFNGDVYYGQWINSMKNGLGIMKFSSGDSYEGNWEKDLIHGYGTFRYCLGGVYSGKFRYCKKHGCGTQWYANGDVYRGYWKEDHMIGHGSYKLADGLLSYGLWKSKLFVELPSSINNADCNV